MRVCMCSKPKHALVDLLTTVSDAGTLWPYGCGKDWPYPPSAASLPSRGGEGDVRVAEHARPSCWPGSEMR